MTKLVSMIAVAGLAGSALAQGGTSMGSATNWAGAQTVTGAYTAAVSSEQLVFSRDVSIASGAATATFNVGGLTAGNAFRAVTGAAAGGPASFDTRLRVRNSANVVLGNVDDGGPGTFSQVIGSVPGDGDLELTGAYWQNTSYDFGATTTAGSFNMSLFAVTVTTPGVSTQWYRFTGLGGSIEAETSNLAGGLSDTTMAIFNSAGTMLAFDDDGGAGFASLITGLASPGDGTIFVAVCIYHGFAGQDTNAYYDNNSSNTAAGTFDLRVVPTPGSLALLGLGAVAGFRRRR